MPKILLVEDDNNLREIYEARLQAEGYTIVSAHDGEEALVVAKAETPDLIISDVMMPKISGFEMLDILRNTDTLKNVKIMMLTALGQNDDQQRANKLGADRYLVKSQVTLEDIVKVANELVQPNTVAEPTPAPTAPTPTAQPVVATPPAPPTVIPTPPMTPPAPAVTPPAPPPPIAAPTPTAQPVVPAPPAPAAPATINDIAPPPTAIGLNPASVVSSVPINTATTPPSAPPQINIPEPAVTTVPSPSPAPATAAPEVAATPMIKKTSGSVELREEPNNENKGLDDIGLGDSTDQASKPEGSSGGKADKEQVGGYSPQPTGKKVIQPLPDMEAKPNLNELLEQEKAKEILEKAAVEAANAPPTMAAADTAPAPSVPIITPASGQAPAKEGAN